MRISFATWAFHPHVGGTERLVEMLCDAFVDRGHEICVVTQTPQGADTRSFPYKILRNPTRSAYYDVCRWADINLHASLQLRRLGPALVARRPLLVQHNYYYRSPHFGSTKVGALKTWVSRALPGVAVSHFLAREMHSAHVVLNPYDTRIFKNTTPWDTRSGDLIVVGRLVKAKGIEVVLAAMALLRDQGHIRRMTLVGEGPGRPAIEREIQALNLGNQVHLAGQMNPQQVVETLNTHRIMLVPSIIEEGFGMVAVEGMACGCAVIASDIGGLPDAVGAHGVCVPPSDPHALAQALKALPPDAPRPSVLEGVETHLGALTLETAADRYLEILKSRLPRSHS